MIFFFSIKKKKKKCFKNVSRQGWIAKWVNAQAMPLQRFSFRAGLGVCLSCHGVNAHCHKWQRLEVDSPAPGWKNRSPQVRAAATCKKGGQKLYKFWMSKSDSATSLACRYIQQSLSIRSIAKRRRGTVCLTYQWSCNFANPYLSVFIISKACKHNPGFKAILST